MNAWVKWLPWSKWPRLLLCRQSFHCALPCFSPWHWYIELQANCWLGHHMTSSFYVCRFSQRTERRRGWVSFTHLSIHVYSVAIECFLWARRQERLSRLEWPNMDAHVSYQGQITSPNGALRKMSWESGRLNTVRRKKRTGMQWVHRDPLPLLHPWRRFTSQACQHSPKFTFPNSSAWFINSASEYLSEDGVNTPSGILTHQGMNISTHFIKTLRMVMVLRCGGARLSRRSNIPRTWVPKSV